MRSRWVVGGLLLVIALVIGTIAVTLWHDRTHPCSFAERRYQKTIVNGRVVEGYSGCKPAPAAK